MENNIISIPAPQPFRKRVSYGKKVFLMGLQCFVLMIGALIVYIISEERESRLADVSQSIREEWGSVLYVSGPEILDGRKASLPLCPESYKCDINVESKLLHRNIYEVGVFDAEVNMSGSFITNDVRSAGDSVKLIVYVNPKTITGLKDVVINGKPYKWSKSSDHLFAKIDTADLSDAVNFETSFHSRGSGGISVGEWGRESEICISGRADNPSFGGSDIPDTRLIEGKNFSACWHNSNDSGYADRNKTGFVRVDFLVGVSLYQKVSRSLKYSFIIILLTFVSVLFIEIMMKHPIPLFNYFLIGAALVLFYCLLLAFSEHIAFGYAYLAASFMTVALISGYMWRMLSSKKTGMAICVILTGMYLGCYIMLCLDTYALLFGAILLFAALAATMYASLRIKQ
ncbi:MAG: cell envelope integrity protein CreD [Muribaculaceae bacterium]|nr:cell envelope integrity protein CreD [Muribaculaceae bacterium]